MVWGDQGCKGGLKVEFSLKTILEEDLQYLIEAKGGQEWLFNHYIALYPCNDGWYQLIYDGHHLSNP